MIWTKHTLSSLSLTHTETKHNQMDSRGRNQEKQLQKQHKKCTLQSSGGIICQQAGWLYRSLGHQNVTIALLSVVEGQSRLALSFCSSAYVHSIK